MSYCSYALAGRRSWTAQRLITWVCGARTNVTLAVTTRHTHMTATLHFKTVSKDISAR